MTDFAAYIFHVNREDLLEKAYDSVGEYMEDLTIVDNSQGGWSKPGIYMAESFRPPVPLSAAQSINLAMIWAKIQEKKFCIIMHEDAEAQPGSAQALLDYARRVDAEGRKWGVLLTNYDCLAILNPKMIDDIGLWDTNLPQYFTDNDYYRRLKLGGWEFIDTCIPVNHLGSQTINSDPELAFLNSVTFPMYQGYYTRKWGGTPGNEKFTTPFGR